MAWDRRREINQAIARNRSGLPETVAARQRRGPDLRLARGLGKGAATTCRAKKNFPPPHSPLCGGEEHGKGGRSSSTAARREAIVSGVSATARARLARAPTGIRTRRD